MKRLLVLCGLVALLPVFANSASASSTYVQQIGSAVSKTSVRSLAVPVSVSVPAGDLVVVAAASMAGLGPKNNGLAAVDGSVTDSEGNIYSATAPVRAYSLGGREAIFVSQLTTALVAGDKLTFSFYSLSGSIALQALDFQGSSGALSDANRNVNSDGSTSPNEAGGVTATGGSLVFALVDVNGPASDSYTNDASALGGDAWHVLVPVGSTGGPAASNLTMHVAYKLPSVDAAQEYKPTIRSRPWEASIVSLN